MDLVVGATGAVGGSIAKRLRQAGREVRVMLRGGAKHPRAEELKTSGMTVVDGDLRNADTLAAACKRAEVVICTVTTMPHGSDDGIRQVDRDGTLALIEAAENAGAGRFIYLSYSGGIREECPLHEAKRACEARLAESSMDSAVLRPSFFMQAWLGGHALDLAKGTLRVYGDGTAPISFVSAADVARLGAAVVERGEAGQLKMEIGGPQPIAPVEAGRRIGAAVNRALAIEHVPVEALQAMQASEDPVQSTFGALGLAYAQGNAIPDAAETAARYGVALTSVAEYAASLRG